MLTMLTAEQERQLEALLRMRDEVVEPDVDDEGDGCAPQDVELDLVDDDVESRDNDNDDDIADDGRPKPVRDVNATSTSREVQPDFKGSKDLPPWAPAEMVAIAKGTGKIPYPAGRRIGAFHIKQSAQLTNDEYLSAKWRVRSLYRSAKLETDTTIVPWHDVSMDVKKVLRNAMKTDFKVLGRTTGLWAIDLIFLKHSQNKVDHLKRKKSDVGPSIAADGVAVDNDSDEEVPAPRKKQKQASKPKKKQAALTTGSINRSSGQQGTSASAMASLSQTAQVWPPRSVSPSRDLLISDLTATARRAGRASPGSGNPFVDDNSTDTVINATGYRTPRSRPVYADAWLDTSPHATGRAGHGHASASRDEEDVCSTSFATGRSYSHPRRPVTVGGGERPGVWRRSVDAYREVSPPIGRNQRYLDRQGSSSGRSHTLESEHRAGFRVDGSRQSQNQR